LPDFIWDKKIRKEVKLYLKDLIEKTLQNNSSTNYIKELKEMKPKTYENEFVIDNIYIKLYNKDPHWKIKECDSFLEKIKQVFIKLNDSNHNLNNNIDLDNKNTEMIFAMSNCVIYSKANEKLLTNDKVFGERLNYILKVKDILIKDYNFKTANIFNFPPSSKLFRENKFNEIHFT